MYEAATFEGKTRRTLVIQLPAHALPSFELIAFDLHKHGFAQTKQQVG
jgi:hypothetical protein